MKKLLALLLAVLFCVGLCACNKSLPAEETLTQGDVTDAAKKCDLIVRVTINPQFDLYLNEKREVIAVQCINFDATELFGGTSDLRVVELSYDEAMGQILQQAKDLGYVGEEGTVTIEPMLPSGKEASADLQNELLTPKVLEFQLAEKVDFVVEEPVPSSETVSVPENDGVQKVTHADGNYSITQTLPSGEKVTIVYNSDDVQLRKDVYNSAGIRTSEWVSGLLWSPDPDPYGYSTTTYYDNGEIKEVVSVSMDGEHGRFTYTCRYNQNEVMTLFLQEYDDGCRNEEVRDDADRVIKRVHRDAETQSYREDYYTYYEGTSHVFTHKFYEEYVEDGASLNKTTTLTLYRNGWMKDGVTEYSDGRRLENHYDEQGRTTKYVDVRKWDGEKLGRLEHIIEYHADGSCTFTLIDPEGPPTVYEYDAQYVQEHMLNHDNHCHCPEQHPHSST